MSNATKTFTAEAMADDAEGEQMPPRLTLSGRSARAWSRLLADRGVPGWDGDAGTLRMQRAWRRGGVDAATLYAMAQAVDAGPREVYDWIRDLAERTAP